VPTEPPAASQPQLAEVWGQLEAARKEMANLQASLSAALKQRDEACRHLIAERVEMAAEKEQGARLVEELTAELAVRGGCLPVHAASLNDSRRPACPPIQPRGSR
jgi:transposase